MWLSALWLIVCVRQGIFRNNQKGRLKCQSFRRPETFAKPDICRTRVGGCPAQSSALLVSHFSENDKRPIKSNIWFLIFWWRLPARQLKLRFRLGSCLRRSDGKGILQRSQAVWKGFRRPFYSNKSNNKKIIIKLYLTAKHHSLIVRASPVGELAQSVRAEES